MCVHFVPATNISTAVIATYTSALPRSGSAMTRSAGTSASTTMRPVVA